MKPETKEHLFLMLESICLTQRKRLLFSLEAHRITGDLQREGFFILLSLSKLNETVSLDNTFSKLLICHFREVATAYDTREDLFSIRKQATLGVLLVAYHTTSF
jgi:hypothetical protein